LVKPANLGCCITIFGTRYDQTADIDWKLHQFTQRIEHFDDDKCGKHPDQNAGRDRESQKRTSRLCRAAARYLRWLSSRFVAT